MEWVRDNYEKLIFAAVSLLLVACGVLLHISLNTFSTTFTAMRGAVPHRAELPQVNLERLKEADARVREPIRWDRRGALFVSQPYILKGNILIRPDSDVGPPIHPPVPNKWIVDNRLDISDNGVLAQDPDADGFTNLDEYNGGTDPLNKESHPPYITKLVLTKIIKIRFRLHFAAISGDSYQINTIDVSQPSQFVRVGDRIAGTPYKVIGFEVKKVINPATGSEKDVSELSIEHLETHKKVILVLDTIVDSPDSVAVFRYVWNGNEETRRKRDEEFTLAPETETRYKLVDIGADEVVIQNLKTGQKTTVRMEH